VKVELLEIDSEVFGRNVLAISDFSASDDLALAEAGYVKKFRPGYVSCKVAVNDLAVIHALEKRGFNFVECQIKSLVRFRRPFDTAGFPYVFERVTNERQLGDVLAIAGATFTEDRFTADPGVGKALSGERYRRYVRRSFEAKDEAVYRLVDPRDGQTLAFKTHRYVGKDEVLFLLGGVHPEYKAVGLGTVNEYFEFNELMSKGIKQGHTHISAANFAVFNLEIGRLGFRVVAVYAVLRKLYD